MQARPRRPHIDKDRFRDGLLVATAIGASIVAGWLEPRGRWPYITAILIMASALAIAWRWHGITKSIVGGIAIFRALLLLLGVGNWMDSVQNVSRATRHRHRK